MYGDSFPLEYLFAFWCISLVLSWFLAKGDEIWGLTSHFFNIPHSSIETVLQVVFRAFSVPNSAFVPSNEKKYI